MAGVAAIVAVAGLVAASGTGASILGAQSDQHNSRGMMGGSGSGMMGEGHMYQHQWSYQYSNYSAGGGCYDYDWNHSYDYGDSGCPCM